jgi:serine/threonine protein kinase
MNSAMNLRDLDSATGEDAELAEVLERYLAALETGGAPTTEQLLARHPALAARLERCLASLRFVEGVAPELTMSGADNGEPCENRRLGDFRILREVGRGGMGVVYEAEQLSLARRVALKILPFAAVLDPRHLQRFKNEALAAAHLDHPHIVEVYGIGCERGIHFYAMRFIDGVTLAEVIAERRSQEPEVRSQKEGGQATASEDSSLITPHSSLPPDTVPVVRAALSTVNSLSPKERLRRVAELGVQAAEALEHAHQTGIVHRDIKPSNLMLDERGKLWITDFGLARNIADASMTMTGDLVGTLRYMSPEQAESRNAILDHRTDIYSLGATLYELATDRPVVEGQERAQILREIAEKDPASPRKHTPAMPADLETILLKCLAKEPSARYSTATALAEDLRRFLEQKPIVARRPSAWDRIGKWSRRHGQLIGGAAIAATLFAIASTVFLFALKAERDRLAIANHDLLTIVEYYDDRSQAKQTETPIKATQTLSRLVDESKSNGEEVAQRALARAHAYLATVEDADAASNDSNPDLARAIGLFEQLVAQNPGSSSLKADLAIAHNLLGNHLYCDRAEYVAAFGHWRRSYDLWKDSEGAAFWLEPSYLAFSIKVAESYATCPDRSIDGANEAMAIAREWQRHSPASDDVAMLLGAAYCANHDWVSAVSALGDLEGSIHRGHPGFLLALAYAEQGDIDKAKSALIEARRWSLQAVPAPSSRKAIRRWAVVGIDLETAAVEAVLHQHGDRERN